MSRTPPPIEIDASQAAEGGPLGMSPARFLRDYWQKRPLLIRNAFPGFVSPIAPEDLAGLACEDGVLARIVSHQREGDRWLLRQGPFEESLFPGLPDRDWTLLVQDVDKWDADVAALLPHFDFLPRWRIDDIMVSFAATGGSVGAHIDQYDVFLLQAHGHRRWQIDDRPDPPLGFRPDVELKLLQRFDPSHDWVLAPGDMLYLPPGVPHHGVAEDPCLTFSVGMRAPSAAELVGDWVDAMIAEADDALRYRDPDLAPPADPHEIDAAAMGRVVEALNLLRMNDPDRLGDWFGRFITLYRASGEAMPGDAQRSRIEVEWDLQAGGVLHRHPWTRMAWRRARKGARLYAAGQDLALPARDAQAIAAAPAIDGADYERLSQAGRDAVIALLEGGHYRLLMPGDDAGDEDEAAP
ncbi:cupin domain-containing protein [Luteimonas sp. Y-2-2-4F]|nr:cupin domain-containing protein [Luteimonas sp. Y-2-2-4F]MCD9031993.1 cupin domain-containing protein [Luteimonas sp. Y-2-2-4F]